MMMAEQRSIRLHGRSTTIRLETPFWQALEKIAQDQTIKISTLIIRIEQKCRTNDRQNNLASCLRVFCLKHYGGASIEGHVFKQVDGSLPEILNTLQGQHMGCAKPEG